MSSNCRPDDLRILDPRGSLFVECPAQDVEGLRDGGVTMKHVPHWGGANAVIATTLDVFIHEIKRFGNEGIVDDTIVIRIANVPIDGDRVRGHRFEVEPGCEERSVEVVGAASRRVAMQLADAEEELASERRVGQLNRGKRPHQRVPVANRHSGGVPWRARSDDVVVGIVERAGRSEEICKEKIAVDQPIDRFVTGALFQRPKSFARDGEQLAPPAAAEDFDRGQRGIPFGRAGNEERALLSSGGRHSQRPTQLVRLPVDGDRTGLVGGDGQRDKRRDGGPLHDDGRPIEECDGTVTRQCARRLNPKLLMAEDTPESNDDVTVD